MKKSIFVFLLTLILSAPISAQQTSSPGGAVPQFPIMRPDPVTLQKWMDDYETAPGLTSIQSSIPTCFKPKQPLLQLRSVY